MEVADLVTELDSASTSDTSKTLDWVTPLATSASTVNTADENRP